MKHIFFLIISFVLFLNCSFAASYSCKSAGLTAIEKAICDTPSLSKADEDLSVLYNEAKLKSFRNSEEFQLISKRLLVDRNKCNRIDCIEEWYQIANDLYSEIIKKGGAYYNIGDPTYGKDDEITLAKGILEINASTSKYYSRDAGDSFVLKTLCNKGISINACNLIGMANLIYSVIKKDMGDEASYDTDRKAVIYLKKSCKANWPYSCDYLNNFYDGEIEKVTDSFLDKKQYVTLKMPKEKKELYHYG